MASADDAPPQSIRSLFEAAESKRRAIESAAHGASSEDVASSVSLYSRALEAIAAASVFSHNEGLEDLSTTHIPLLLASFHLAELVQRTPTVSSSSLQERRSILARARIAYERFLDLVDAYNLVDAQPYKKLLERYRDDREGFSVAGGGPGVDAAARRAIKIASFKAEKELKQKLEMLRREPRYLEHGDEEIVRELHLAEVAFAVHTTFNSLDSMNREVSLLAEAPPPLPDTNAANGDALSRPRATDYDPTLRLDGPLQSRIGAGGPILSKEGKPLQPFTLVGSSGSRQELRRGVFRPGHNLPTMSIDEYLEEEKRRGNILQGGEQPKPELDEDDMDAMDRETYKAREWDEFKDHNPKGSGNTLNMG